MQKTCAEHGDQEARLSTNASWYERTRALKPIDARPKHVRAPIEHGCPFDCGPCASHTQKIRLPVITITSACDLDCPICYVHNKNKDAFYMSPAEFGRVIDGLVEASDGDLDLVNLTGGEPLLHPNIVELVTMCHARGIHRVSVCSNGVRLVKDRALLDALAKAGARIALSFDSFEHGPDYALQGANLVDLKLQCLDLLNQHGMDTTLIPVMTKGHNDHEIGRILAFGLDLPCVRHIEVHTITYTGQGGKSFDPERASRISMFEVLERIEQTTNGALRASDFIPSPSAHPLCYQIAYLLLDARGGPPVPFHRFLSPETMYQCLNDHLYLEPSPRFERAMQDAIDDLWASGGDERTLGMLNHLLRAMYPPGEPLDQASALAASEKLVKAVYIHSHMDEETFDVERAYQCCDSNVYADGRSIPVCNYNVLYRDKEPRFMTAPATWGDRSGGRRALPIVP